MKYQIVPVTPFQQNCSLVWCSQTNKGAVIDPGGDIELVEAAIASLGIEVEKVLLTHAHIDHAGASRMLADKLQVPLVGPHKADQFWLDQLPQQAQMFGLALTQAFQPDRYLEDGQAEAVGNLTLNVLHTPGHTPGHVVFYEADSGTAFVGDVLFSGSIGRTDFPMSNHGDLIASITQKLWPLGDATEFVPGHGPNSTFGAERRSNPFVADAVLAG
ncbi:Glyoxylase, beta-lactamase superfamily II [Ferrimonas sediminum]|uniref:Glyoxylase, beta-lactamase superfamily II n=1 Tax=Ferrimonas sediminum TaxID=718193 RepID=A0A1G8RCW5_9GAMM|nr:MBL fold metallo-hydrolase [Ferrimonas sediminum]SDJ14847.1 Glyoxylase, beta-lactamase superfamily II [Ferrimonas sediminum]